jgi:2-haloacid dehalogenase
MNRRAILKVAGVAAAAAGLRRAGSQTVSPKALVFDTFGTVVGWRGSIIAEGNAWNKAKGTSVDWATFADRWRAGYAPAMDKVRKGELPWTKLDALHRMILDQLLPEFGLTSLTEEEKDHWNSVWHRLKPWADSVSGLARLKKKFLIAPLSNGNVSLLAEMGKNAGLPWDLILGAEVARHYKPDREAYLTAVELLSLTPGEVMMCAAHSSDLNAARSFGLRTGFIYRPNEYGPARKADQARSGEFDVVSTSILDLADKLGA